MTNLLAIISFCIVTNWTTTAKIYPVSSESRDGFCNAVYRPIKLLQVGCVQSNTVAAIVYDGKTNAFIVKSVNISYGMTREIFESEGIQAMWDNLDKLKGGP